MNDNNLKEDVELINTFGAQKCFYIRETNVKN